MKVIAIALPLCFICEIRISEEEKKEEDTTQEK